ncbi:MAG: universal stress protein [Acidimicrobiales bacterium]|nr:universal stress protein [Acidimicrobiales bacterium]
MTVRRIVVGVDESDNARTAVVWAAELAAQLGASVLAVHGFEPLAHLGRVAPPVDFVAVRAACEADLAEGWTAPLRDAGVAHECRVLERDPVGALVEAADEVDADLIVVGARGGSTLRGLVLGSTSLKLPHVTRRPVCIVHPVDGG